MEQKEKVHNILCICCPEGCEMEVLEKNGKLVIPKHICEQGRDYATQEIVNPCRFLTTTVKLKGADIAMLPVHTTDAIPKPKLERAMQQIAAVEVNVSIKLGDVICADLADTGIALVSSKTVTAA